MIGQAMTMATMLVLFLALAALAWMSAPRPQPIKVRRNRPQEDLLTRDAEDCRR